MDGVTIGQIAGWLALIAGIFTSFGVIYKVMSTFASKALDKALERALQPMIEKQSNLEDEVAKFREELRQNNLETARVDLMQAIEHTPGEHKAILELGWHYFVELEGDAWMSGVFREWATRENVDISYIAARAAHLKG